ncbi:MAG: hypothetical protein K1W21_05010 [Oscillospiraceae bacterium]
MDDVLQGASLWLWLRQLLLSGRSNHKHDRRKDMAWKAKQFPMPDEFHPAP